jgi:uncharacterized protein YbaP (TraB family)
LKDLELIGSMVTEMVSAWMRGDADKLGFLMNMSFEDHPDIYDRLVTQRNKNWMATIDRLSEQAENVFVVVGAGHLVGKESLLDLMKARGYRVDQR